MFSGQAQIAVKIMAVTPVPTKRQRNAPWLADY